MEKQNAEAQNAYNESKQIYLEWIQQYEHNALVNSDVQMTFLPVLEDKLQVAKVTFADFAFKLIQFILFYLMLFFLCSVEHTNRVERQAIHIGELSTNERRIGTTVDARSGRAASF